VEDCPPEPDAAQAAAGSGFGLRELTRLRRSRLALAAALPSAAGYTVPLVAGLATGHVADGLTASAGALIVGFANLGGPYRVRSGTLLAATAAAGLAALVGGLAGPDTAAAIAAMSGWGFAGGLLVALGTRAAFVGLLSTWALLLASDLSLHGTAVLRAAGLITAGGAVQTVIAVAAWPLRPFAAERRAVADAYRALAVYARAPGTATLYSATAALATAAETVAPGTAPAAPRGLLRAQTEQAEWVRVELTALARSDAPGSGPTRQAAARALDVVAAGGDLAPALAGLRHSAQGIGDPAARRQAEQLTAWITAAGRQSRRGVPRPVPRPRPLRALRAELTWNSSVFRHAARLSAALVVAGIVYRGLSLGRGYWVPLTVLMVLKPDYGTTITRGIARAAGTMAGVIMAWLAVTLFSPPADAIVVLLALLAGVAYAVFPANYALFSLLLAVLVALLAEFSGGSPVGVLLDRIIDTAIGTAIALGAVLLWPTREAPHTLDGLTAYAAAEGEWLDAILTAYADGDATQALRATRLAARHARTLARAAVERSLSEPRRRRPDGAPLRAVLAALDEISEYALVLVAAVHDGARAPREAVGAARGAVRDSFRTLCALLPGAARPASPLAGVPGGPDQALTVVAAETARVLAALQQLERP
jgi:uncharacterized membrane protein YccC